MSDERMNINQESGNMQEWNQNMSVGQTQEVNQAAATGQTQEVNQAAAVGQVQGMNPDFCFSYTSYGTGQTANLGQMTREQKRAQAKVEKAAKKAEKKRIKAQQKQAEKEQEKVKNRYPIGKRILASVVCGVFFAGAAFGTLYTVEQLTGLTILVNGEKETVSSNDIPVVNTLADAETGTAADVLNVNSDSGIDVLEKGSESSVAVFDVTTVVKKVMPAIVSIENDYVQNVTYWGRNYSQEGTASGSGIIVGKNETELLIATNYHVIEGAETLRITFINDATAEADVKGTDSENDLAIIAVQLNKLDEETKQSIAIAALGDSDSLEVGEPVIAIGNALGYGQSVTTGVVSAVNREVEGVGGKMIQTDAAINPGNSGGALLNAKGEVIGINSAKIASSTIEGMGYAIPISYAEPIMQNLMEQSTRVKLSDAEKGYLGIAGVNVSADVSAMYKIPEGVYIYQVYEGTGADEAGLLQGDVIVALNGTTIDSMETLQRELQYYAVGTTVELKVRRAANGYEAEIVELVLGERFEDNNTEK